MQLLGPQHLGPHCAICKSMRLTLDHCRNWNALAAYLLLHSLKLLALGCLLSGTSGPLDRAKVAWATSGCLSPVVNICCSGIGAFGRKVIEII